MEKLCKTNNILNRERTVRNIWNCNNYGNKYNAEKTVIDGIKFDSKKEARRYAELKLLERAGVISDLKLQPKFVLQEGFRQNGKAYREISYIADFSYVENGKLVVEDTKGFKTEVFKIKEKLFRYKYGNVDFRVL